MRIDESLFKKGLRVGVALSGGRDSSALFHYLYTNKERLGITLSCINVEHGIRDKSKEETALIEAHCNKLKVPVRVYKVDVPAHAKEYKMTVEQSARELRYECFDKAICENFCDVIATAHHLEDDAETILMRIFRGTGIRGLSGISRERGRIIRPILNCSRDEIDEYLKVNGIAFFEDETNDDVKYTRNFLRNEVLPLIKTRYPKVSSALIRLAESSAVDEAHFQKLIKDKIVPLSYGAYGVKCEDLEDEAQGARLIIKAFSMLGVCADVESRHVKLIRELTCAENGTTLDMPYFIRASKEYDTIVFDRVDQKDEREYEIKDIPFRCELSGLDFSLDRAQNREKEGLFVDLDKIKGAVIRTRREGDRFKRFGGGTKSLGDYFTDVKLPVRLRDKIAVIAKENEILAVFGLEISEYAKIEDKTTKIIKLNGGQNVFGRS